MLDNLTPIDELSFFTVIILKVHIFTLQNNPLYSNLLFCKSYKENININHKSFKNKRMNKKSILIATLFFVGSSELAMAMVVKYTPPTKSIPKSETIQEPTKYKNENNYTKYMNLQNTHRQENTHQPNPAEIAVIESQKKNISPENNASLRSQQLSSFLLTQAKTAQQKQNGFNFIMKNSGIKDPTTRITTESLEIAPPRLDLNFNPALYINDKTIESCFSCFWYINFNCLSIIIYRN